MRISDWSSDVCSSDLGPRGAGSARGDWPGRARSAAHPRGARGSTPSAAGRRGWRWRRASERDLREEVGEQEDGAAGDDESVVADEDAQEAAEATARPENGRTQGRGGVGPRV